MSTGSVLASAVTLPEPKSLKIFIAMMRTDQLTPATPRLLLVAAPMVPETWVPCPCQSFGTLSSSRKSHPVTSSMYPLLSSSMLLLLLSAPSPSSPVSPGFRQMLAARSGCP